MTTVTPGNQRGMAGAALHANHRYYDWLAKAIALISNYPKDRFMTEELRQFARDQKFPKPPNERAWGAVIRQAKRDGLIKVVGERYSKQTYRNAPVWGKTC